MILYVDSSALLRRYLNRPGGIETDAVLAGADALGTASVTRVEVAAAITRLASGGSIAKGAATRAFRALDQDLAHLSEVGISSVVVQAAYELAKRHSLKGYDAIHLGAAAIWKAELGEPVTVATFDDQLWAAACSEGLAAWPHDLSVFKL